MKTRLLLFATAALAALVLAAGASAGTKPHGSQWDGLRPHSSQWDGLSTWRARPDGSSWS